MPFCLHSVPLFTVYDHTVDRVDREYAGWRG